MENPYDPAFVNMTVEDVRSQPEYKLALKLAKQVQRLAPVFTEKYKLASLFDQLTRNTQSVLLNFCESYGRGRGHYQSALWIARGEAFEVVAALDLSPDEVSQHLLPAAEELCGRLSERIKNCPAPPCATKWSGRRWD